MLHYGIILSNLSQNIRQDTGGAKKKSLKLTIPQFGSQSAKLFRLRTGLYVQYQK